MVFEVLSGSSHCSLSNPIETGWLEKINHESQKRKIILVGEGITSSEYGAILSRAGITFIVITASQFLKNRLCYDNEIGGGNPFFIFAAPSRLIDLYKHAAELGLLPKQDFFSHFDALRNRMVIDLRGGSIKKNSLITVIDTALSLPTLGGIDVFAIDMERLEEIESFIEENTKILHSKAILFPNIGGKLGVSRLIAYDTVEINITHMQGFEDGFDLFFKSLQSEVEKNEKSYLMVNEEVFKKYCSLPSSRIYCDSSHAWYFDEMLLALESGSVVSTPKIKCGKTNMCLSRRMFPVLDENLLLKKCSLYDRLGKTGYPIFDIQSDGFIAERKALCERCIKFNIHRIG